MLELYQASIALANLPYTIFLCLMTLYWLLYILGFIGSETMDFLHLDFLHLDFHGDMGVDVHPGHVDVGVDVDPGGVHADLPGHAHADADVGGHDMDVGMIHALQFFHIGVVPVMIIFSILVISMWAAAVTFTHFFHLENAWFFPILFIPNFTLGMLVTRTVLKPFVPLLKNLFDETGDRIDLIGKMCLVTSLEVTPKYGQAEYKLEGAPLVLNVVTKEGVTLKKGDEAVIYEYEDEKNRYLVAKLD